MKLIWKGPPTAVEVYPATPDKSGKLAAPLFSGPVVTDGALTIPDVDADHPQIASWLAFKLVEIEAADADAPARAPKPNKKDTEAANG